ncbi:MAG: hypothetical protein F9K32_04625 [Desulfobulbaceae bacterium]|nr:MAG: hypothetical protein F9K32_04625 [Desulfobulbaceae bacterium]
MPDNEKTVAVEPDLTIRRWRMQQIIPGFLIIICAYEWTSAGIQVLAATRSLMAEFSIESRYC